MPANLRKRAFISYSHKDKRYLDRVHAHLAPYEREGRIDYWDDTKIGAGADWKQEIQSALDTAKVAILLVSADFLASRFIAENELPSLLEAAKTHGTEIFIIVLSPCAFSTSPLAKFQAVHDTSRPLSGLRKHEKESIWTKLAREVATALASQATSPHDVNKQRRPSSHRPPYPGVIAIASFKGGVGKTITTIHLGAFLAEMGCRTLLVDMDPQCIVTWQFCGNKQPSPSLSNLLIDKDAMLSRALQVELRPHLSLLPGDDHAALVNANFVSVERLRTLLDTAEADYDFVIIDCPPGRGLLTMNALVAADVVVMPIASDRFSYQSVQAMRQTIEQIRLQYNTQLKLFGIVLNIWQTSRPTDIEIEQLRQGFLREIFNTVIPEIEGIRKGMRAETLLDTSYYSAGAQAYKQLAHELIARVYRWRRTEIQE